MTLIIKKQEKKPLLSRLEIEAVAKDTITAEQARAEISQKLNRPAELIVVKGIYRNFGSKEAAVRCYVYESVEALNRFEAVPKKKAKEAKKEEKVGAEEGKKEEKKEEIKEAKKEEKEEARKKEGKKEAAEKKNSVEEKK